MKLRIYRVYRQKVIIMSYIDGTVRLNWNNDNEIAFMQSNLNEMCVSVIGYFLLGFGIYNLNA